MVGHDSTVMLDLNMLYNTHSYTLHTHQHEQRRCCRCSPTAVNVTYHERFALVRQISLTGLGLEE